MPKVIILFHKIPPAVLCLLGGLLFALGFPIGSTFYYIPLAPLLGFALLLTAIRPFENLKKHRAKFYIKNFLYCCCFSVAYSMVGASWFSHSLSNLLNRSLMDNIGLLLPFPIIHLPMIYCIPLIQWGIDLTLIRARHPNNPSSDFRYILWSVLFAFLLAIAEYFVPAIFPCFFGFSWMAFSFLMPLATFFGVHGFSFITFLLALAAHMPWRQAKALLLAIVTILFFGSFLPIRSSRNLQTSQTLNIRLVQANVGNGTGVRSDVGDVLTKKELLQRLFALSSRQETGKIADLIIWSEGVYPFSLNSDRLQSKQLFEDSFIKQYSSTVRTFHLLGVQDVAATNRLPEEKYFNSAFYVSPEGFLDSYYHKIHLLALAEAPIISYHPLAKWFNEYFHVSAGIGRGDRFVLFHHPKGFSFLPTICLEIIQTQFINSFYTSLPELPDFFVNLASDMRFGNSSEPYQHFELQRWRAIEYQTPIVRVANTGISGVIWEDGSTTSTTSINEAVSITTSIPKVQRSRTFYAHYPILSLVLLALITLTLSLLFGRRAFRPSFGG